MTEVFADRLKLCAELIVVRVEEVLRCSEGVLRIDLQVFAKENEEDRCGSDLETTLPVERLDGVDEMKGCRCSPDARSVDELLVNRIDAGHLRRLRP